MAMQNCKHFKKKETVHHIRLKTYGGKVELLPVKYVNCEMCGRQLAAEATLG